MIDLSLSTASFLAGWFAARRSFGAGVSVCLVAGYFYGIVRARYLGLSYFQFDAAAFGVYLVFFFNRGGLRSIASAAGLYRWTACLVCWPLLVFSMGIMYPQHPLIQLVGLRAAIWFLPFLLFGVRADSGDLRIVARTLAVLNVVALMFAVAEYFLGIERFFPRNAVTDIIYRSKDVAGFSAYRIPSTFSAAAAYGGAMVASLPLIIGRWMVPGTSGREKLLMTAGVLAAALGVFLCGSRSPVIILFAFTLVLSSQFRGRFGYFLATLMVAGVVAYFVADNERLQRFTTLRNTELVAERIRGSVNLNVLEVLLDYPLGAGLGSAWGTSIPSFLSHLAKKQIGAENEYARIGLEQGLFGLSLWLSFLFWLLARRAVSPAPGWEVGAKLMRLFVFLSWSTALIGCGMLTAIPGTGMVLFQMGVIGRSRVPARSERRSGPPRSEGRRTGTAARPQLVGGRRP